MSAVLWIVLALGAGALLVAGTAWRTRRLLAPFDLPSGETLPTTPLQRLAGVSLIGMLFLVFWSCLVASMLAWLMAILLGYRRG